MAASVAVLLLLSAGCATVPHADTAPVPADAEASAAGELDDDVLAAILDPLQEEATAIADPLEPWNRAMFYFNDKLYFWLLKPLAQGYQFVVPRMVRTSVKNFFTNFATPIRFTNALLQLKLRTAGTELERLLLNTTIGVGGLMDPADAWFGHPLHDEDFGQTLGVYGLGPGIYLVWPLIGPLNLRDTVGYAGDIALNPATYFVPLSGCITSGLEAGRRVNNTSLEIGRYERIKREALDPYLYVREAYSQRRKRLILE